MSKLHIEPISGDLWLETYGGVAVPTFVANPTDDHELHILGNATHLALYQGAVGLEIVTPDT